MAWLFALPLLLLLVGTALCMPYDAFRVAVRNTHRGDGARSPSRTQREVRHAQRLLWRTLLAPLLLMLVAGLLMRGFHLYVMPDSPLGALFGEYHPEVSLHAPDLDAWEEAIEASRRDEAHQAWREAQGLSPTTATSWKQALTEHWPVHFLFLVALYAFVPWYLLRTTPRATKRYREGVAARSRRYLHRDLADVLD